MEGDFSGHQSMTTQASRLLSLEYQGKTLQHIRMPLKKEEIER